VALFNDDGYISGARANESVLKLGPLAYKVPKEEKVKTPRASWSFQNSGRCTETVLKNRFGAMCGRRKVLSVSSGHAYCTVLLYPGFLVSSLGERWFYWSETTSRESPELVRGLLHAILSHLVKHDMLALLLERVMLMLLGE
jgi:hypothetical protein